MYNMSIMHRNSEVCICVSAKETTQKAKTGTKSKVQGINKQISLGKAKINNTNNSRAKAE